MLQEVTSSVLAARGTSLLRDTARSLAVETNLGNFWQKIVDALAPHRFDNPSILAYSATATRPCSSPDNQEAEAEGLVFEAFSRVPVKDTGVPCTHELPMKNEEIISAFREAFRTGSPQKLDISDQMLVEYLAGPSEQPKGNDKMKKMVVTATSLNMSSRVLVVGIDPYRPRDDEYNAFATNAVREASATPAAIDKARFAEQAVKERELRFIHMTEISPTAHFELNVDGKSSTPMTDGFQSPVCLGRGLRYQICHG
jgi:hypothetical protein